MKRITLLLASLILSISLLSAPPLKPRKDLKEQGSTWHNVVRMVKKMLFIK